MNLLSTEKGKLSCQVQKLVNCLITNKIYLAD